MGTWTQMEAEKAFRQAISLRPLAWDVYNRAGGFYYRQGKYPEAAAMFAATAHAATIKSAHAVVITKHNARIAGSHVGVGRLQKLPAWRAR